MFCSKCGAQLAPGTRFCVECGTPAPVQNYENQSATQAVNNTTEAVKTQNVATEILEQVDTGKTVIAEPAPVQQPVNPAPQQAPVQQPVNQIPQQAPVPQPASVQQPVNQIPQQDVPYVAPMPPTPPKKKSGAGIVIGVAILTVLVLLAFTGGAYFLWSHVLSQKIKPETNTNESYEDQVKEKRKHKKEEPEDNNGESEDSDMQSVLNELFGNKATTEEPVEVPAEVVEETEYPVETAQPAVTETALYTVRVNAQDGYVNLRNTTEINNSNIISQILTGSLLDVYEENGDWYKVKLGYMEGWVHRTQVTPVEMYADNQPLKQLCPWSDKELIRYESTVDILYENATQVYGLNPPTNKSFAQMLINEIYARHGYEFSTPEIQEYFMRQPWYYPVTSDMDSVYRNLNSIEKDNIDFLKGMR